VAEYKVPVITGDSLTTGDLLRWDGSDWVNYPDSNYAGAGGIWTTPIFWNMLVAAPDAVGQGTWTQTQANTHIYAGYFQNGGVNGDNFSCNFRCPAGTYTLRFNASKYTNRGVVDIYMDAGEEGSFDLYAGSLDETNIEEIAGLVLTAGEHILKFQLDGQHASSSGYYFAASGIWLQRTA